VGVDLSGADVFVIQNFLNDSYVGALLKKMSCKRMAQSMRRYFFLYAGIFGCVLYYCLNAFR
jgi:hypothetical protein